MSSTNILRTDPYGRFTCNAQNQLKSASKGGKTVEFVYDGLGRCVKRTVNGSATVLAYDDWKPVMQFNSGWWGWNVYGPGADEILWQFRTDVGHLRYHHDRHGNVSSVLDGSGAVVEKYSYNAFGKPSILNEWGHGRAATTVGNRFMFQGREWIPELGIYDYRHRMYHPGLGRFLQVDPTGFDGGDMNLFRYCADDPVNRSDPDGTIDSWRAAMLWQGGGDGTVSEQIARLSQGAGNDGAGSGEGAVVNGQHEGSGPKEPTGRGSRSPTESDEPLRMIPQPQLTEHHRYRGTCYNQLAARDATPLSGADLRFQEVTRRDPKSQFDILRSDDKPAKPLLRGGLFKDGIGFKHRPENVRPGSAALYQGFRSEINGQPGPQDIDATETSDNASSKRHRYN